MKKAMVDMTIVSVNQAATTDAVRSKNRPPMTVATRSAMPNHFNILAVNYASTSIV